MKLIKVTVNRGHYKYNDFYIVESNEEIEQLKVEFEREKESYLHSYEKYQYELKEVDLQKVEMQELEGLK